MKSVKSLLLAGGMCLSAVTGVHAETYRAANYNPATDLTAIVTEWFAKELAARTDNALEFEVFNGGVLFGATATLQSVGAGVVQLGFHSAGYNPSDLPASNALFAGYGFIEPDPTTIGAAFADWLVNDPVGQDQYKKLNIVAIGGFSTPTYPLICNTSEPVQTLEQFQGKKIRWPGGANAKLTQDLGGIPVNLPAPEIYQALQNGQIDCAGILATWLNIDNSLDEVSKSVTRTEWSAVFHSPQFLFNRDFWMGLTDEQRAMIIEMTARGHAMYQARSNANNEKAYETTAAKGHPVVEPDQTLKDAVAAWVANGVGDMEGVARDTYGIADPKALFASFDPYVKKWHDLVAGMKDKTDEDEMTKLLYDNLYSKIDPATFGMN